MADRRTAGLAQLGRALHVASLALAGAWLLLALKWSDFGEGTGYATPLAALAAIATVFAGWMLRRLLVRG